MSETSTVVDPKPPNVAASSEMTERVERLICIASGGAFSEQELREAGGSLRDVGLDSIAYMNLLEGLERSFGVVIDPEEDPQYLSSVSNIVLFLAGQLGHG